MASIFGKESDSAAANPMSYYIFMTELIDLSQFTAKNRWFNAFHDVAWQEMLKRSVASRMLCFIAIDLKIASTPAAVQFRSLSFIAFDRDSRTRFFLVGRQVPSKCS